MPETPELADAQPARTEAEPAQRGDTNLGTDEAAILAAKMGGFIGMAVVSAVTAIETATGMRMSWDWLAFSAAIFLLMAVFLFCELRAKAMTAMTDPADRMPP